MNMNITSNQALALLRAVVEAILETVTECPEGAPEGPLYAACNAHGVSLETFREIVAGLVAAGRIRRSGFILYPVN
jgi:hypothetical protein